MSLILYKFSCVVRKIVKNGFIYFQKALQNPKSRMLLQRVRASVHGLLFHGLLFNNRQQNPSYSTNLVMTIIDEKWKGLRPNWY